MFIYLSKAIKVSSAAVMGVFLLFYLSGAVGATVSISCIALHETGHLLAVYKIKAGVRSLSVLPLGADIRLKRSVSYREDIIISLAGPAASFFCALLGYAVYLFVKADFLLLFSLCSAGYGILNLLPVTGLDGGRALRAACMEKEAEKAYDFISICLLFVLWQVGIFFLLYTSFNASLLLVCSYLFYSVYVKDGINP